MDDVLVDECVRDRRNFGASRNGDLLVGIRSVVFGASDFVRMNLEALHVRALRAGVDLAAINYVAVFDVAGVGRNDANGEEVQAILAGNLNVLPFLVGILEVVGVLVERAIRRLEHAIGGENFGKEHNVLGGEVGGIGQAAVGQSLALGDELEEIHTSAFGVAVRMTVYDGSGVDFPGDWVGFDKVCC